MSKRVAILFCAVAVMLAGCARPLQVKRQELTMMPPDAALQLVRKNIPTADGHGFMSDKMGMCKSKSDVWAVYSEMKTAFYYPKQMKLMISTGGFCGLAVMAYGLSREEAAELVAAMNVLGAKIPQIVVA